MTAARGFWINLYNALVLDALIRFGIQNSVIEGKLGILAFFRRASYQVGEQRVSLEDIEQGILWGNRGQPLLQDERYRRPASAGSSIRFQYTPYDWQLNGL